MRKIPFFLIAILLSVSLASASEHDLTETKQLIDSGISCNELTDEQLEDIGDYYMEQIHHGKAHELMDSMMGGEGSESLKEMHINIARSLYCNENVYVNYSSMRGFGSMMPIMIGGGIMAFGMMSGMGTFGMGLFSLIYFALAAFVFSAIFWLTRNWLVKPKKK